MHTLLFIARSCLALLSPSSSPPGAHHVEMGHNVRPVIYWWSDMDDFRHTLTNPCQDQYLVFEFHLQSIMLNTIIVTMVVPWSHCASFGFTQFLLNCFYGFYFKFNIMQASDVGVTEIQALSSLWMLSVACSVPRERNLTFQLSISISIDYALPLLHL